VAVSSEKQYCIFGIQKNIVEDEKFIKAKNKKYNVYLLDKYDGSTYLKTKK